MLPKKKSLGTQRVSPQPKNHVNLALILSLLNILAGYGALAFTEKLKIWHPIIKGLQTNNLNRYSTYLVTGVLRKIQFRYDPDLKELDNETVDDDVSILSEATSKSSTTK